MTKPRKRSFDCNNARLIAPLRCLRQTDLERAGGKAANLGELIHAGFPVPPGFAVTTAAYEQFVAHNHLDERIAQLLREQPGGAAIRDLFEAAPIPAEVEESMLSFYQELGQGPVAVRSSATAEDLPGATFAGQQDTFLNVIGADALLDAVRRCWASLWTDRAIAYRDRQGIDHAGVRLAVVVQCMVPAEVAGVLFTASPVTGARDEIVIDGSPGLGEAVVSGQVTPDHYVLRRGRLGWRVVERKAGRRELVIQARLEGGTEHVTGQGVAEIPALPNRALYRLALLGAAIQRHFGRPQDVEWAWADGKAFILQARPITALPTPPPRLNRLQQMLANNFVEMLPVRPYPLDLDTWLPALGGAVEPIFSLLGLEWHFRRLFQEEDGVVIHYRPNLPHPTWKVLTAPVRSASLVWRYDPEKWQEDRLIGEAQARVRTLEARELRDLPWEGLFAIVHEAIEIPFWVGGEVRRRYFPRAVLSMARLRVLLMLMGQVEPLGRLLSGAENKTLELNHALENLADKVRADPELASIFAAHPPRALWPALEEQPAGRAFLDELRVFLDRYGHRESMISSARQPTWKDDPPVVLGMIKSFAVHLSPPQTGQPAWQAARDKLLHHPLLRFPPLRFTFLKTLAEARALLQIREDTHFYATLVMPVFRRTLLEMGRRLVQQGILDASEDVFHLRLAELERMTGPQPPAAELRATVGRRKEARARLEGTPLVDLRSFTQPAPEGDALLHGMPGSPGVAEGPARILRDNAEFDKLVAGDVLVAVYTNPSWTPLFQRVVAVIVDSGSPASHAAIVAREYGIPAVMGTMTGTQTLHDGERVRVDGSRGLVFRVFPVAGSDGVE